MPTLCRRLSMLACFVTPLLGCGATVDEPHTVPVSGRVTLDGQPVSEATVSFVPKATEGTAAQAVTNSDGTFVVQSMFDQGRVTKDGMAPGEYLIAVTKLEAIALDPQLTRAPKNLLPLQYANPQLSGLSKIISPDDGNAVTIELKK
jgi:hypothetical protein